MAEVDDPLGAEDVFVEWLALRGTGEARELDELCRAHPALAEELRRLHGEWERVSPLLVRHGLGLAPDGLALALERLFGRAGFDRYVLQDEVARGARTPSRAPPSLPRRRRLGA